MCYARDAVDLEYRPLIRRLRNTSCQHTFIQKRMYTSYNAVITAGECSTEFDLHRPGIDPAQGCSDLVIEITVAVLRHQCCGGRSRHRHRIDQRAVRSIFFQRRRGVTNRVKKTIIANKTENYLPNRQRIEYHYVGNRNRSGCDIADTATVA